MPGDCPASLHFLLFVCGKHSVPSRTPFRWATKTVRLPTGIGVHLQTGMLFGFTTEWCSASERNRVRLRPDSPTKIPGEWEGRGETITRTISEQFTGGATLKKDQPDSTTDGRSVDSYLGAAWILIVCNSCVPVVCRSSSNSVRVTAHQDNT